MKRLSNSLFALMLLFALPFALSAQESTGELAATLEVLSSGVEVLRVNTANWIRVKSEGIVGVGDRIRTDETGRARITFFADGTDTELLPKTEYRITQFEASEQTFNISVEVLIGQTTQRLGRLLDPSSTYEVRTPGMALAARGTVFAIRVEDGGRSAMLVSEGAVNANNEENEGEVPSGYGIRAELGQSLSDVVQAVSFSQLDAALDGCVASVRTQGDVSVNVRIGPALDFPRIGTISASEITTFFGTTESRNWYRIEFRGGYAWISPAEPNVAKGCPGLRLFPDTYGPEDVSQYESVGDTIAPEDLNLPQPEATPASSSG